jgi:Fe2+-dicitrate sensor, membrane component
VNEKIVEFPDKRVVEEEAAFWLIKLDGDDELSTEQRKALDEWLSRSPAHRQELQRLALIWQRMNVLTELSVPIGRAESAKYFATWSFSGLRCLSRYAFATAATVLLCTALYLLGDKLPFASFRDGNTVYTTRIGEQRLILVRDGSTIRLNTNSQVEVNFTREFRDVRLVRGEAEFTVARDPARPFRVYAGNERVQAIGTAFTVYLQNDKLDVLVTEGEVALATLSREAPPSREVTSTPAAPTFTKEEVTYVETLPALKAGQSATMKLARDGDDSLLSALDVEIIEEPEHIDRRLAWRDGLLIFDGDPLENVVHEISRYTTVAIEITDPEVGATKIGGQFPVGETELMLQILESNFGFTITRLGKDRVLISAGVR